MFSTGLAVSIIDRIKKKNVLIPLNKDDIGKGRGV